MPRLASGAGASSAWENLRESFGYIRATPIIAGLIWLAAIPSIFAYSYLSLLPVFAREILQGSSSTLGRKYRNTTRHRSWPSGSTTLVWRRPGRMFSMKLGHTQ